MNQKAKNASSRIKLDFAQVGLGLDNKIMQNYIKNIIFGVHEFPLKWNCWDGKVILHEYEPFYNFIIL